MPSARNPSGRPKRPPLSKPEITSTSCAQCGCKIKGVNDRYACTRCGWVSRSEDGSTELPTEADDPWPRSK